MTHTEITTANDELRRAMRRARRLLSPSQLQQSADELYRRISGLALWPQVESMAAYLAIDGEMDPMVTMRQALAQNKRCFVPLIRGELLRFAPWSPDCELVAGPFGIMEPVVEETTLKHAHELDLVLVPLVAFDANCERVGMGGGYYDRTFAARDRVDGPALVGVAHELQRTAKIETNWWDVRLDYVVTEQAVYQANPDN